MIAQLHSSDPDREAVAPVALSSQLSIDAAKLRELRAIAVQAPITALPLSRPVRERSTILGYVKIVDATSVPWRKLVEDLGLAGASEIKRLLQDCGLAPSSWG
jgi:hypothetical protein